MWVGLFEVCGLLVCLAVCLCVCGYVCVLVGVLVAVSVCLLVFGCCDCFVGAYLLLVG